MNKLTIILIITILINVNSSSLEEEFINMLSKEDKERVLRSIEGRITKEVNFTGEPGKEEIELSDKDMDKHTDYVVKVLRETAESFMNKSAETIEPINMLTTTLIKKVKSKNREIIVESNKPIILLNITTLTEPRAKRMNLTKVKSTLRNESVTDLKDAVTTEKVRRSKIVDDEEKKREHEDVASEDLIKKLDNHDVSKLEPENFHEIGPNPIENEKLESNNNVQAIKPIPIYNYDVQNAFFNPESRFQTVGHTPTVKNLDYEINLDRPREIIRASELNEPQGEPIAIDYLSGRQRSEEWIWKRDDEVDIKINDINMSLEVLTDMFERDNEYLLRYDWLGTTVDVLTALSAIISSLYDLDNSKTFIKIDVNLLNYIKNVYVESSTLSNAQYKALGPMDSQRLYPIFLNQLVKSYEMNFNEDWEEFSLNNNENNDIIRFLTKLEAELSPLHRYINSMASESTMFQNEYWFKLLKKSVANQFDKEETLRILLHILTTNFLDRVEKNYKKNDQIQNDSEVLKQIMQILNQF